MVRVTAAALVFGNAALVFLGSYWGLALFLLLVVAVFFVPPFCLALERRSWRRDVEVCTTADPELIDGTRST